MRELAARRRQAELRELRAAELESRLAEALSLSAGRVESGEAWQRQPRAPRACVAGAGVLGLSLGRLE